jgi:hypothetical protein
LTPDEIIAASINFLRCHSARCGYGAVQAAANAIVYAQFYSRSHHAVIRVYDAAGNIIETHQQAHKFQEW